MAEVTPSATEAQKPVVTVKEAAAYGASEIKGKLPDAEAEKARVVGARLRELREKGARSLDVIREASSRRRSQEFTSGQRDTLTGMFGAETESPTPDTEEGISRESAGNQVKIIGEYLDYSAICIEAQNTGETPEDIARARRLDYKTIREHALDTLSQLSVTREIAGDLSTLSPDDRRNVVEAYLGGQSLYRNEVAKGMQEIWERAKQLPEEPKDPDYEAARKTKEDAVTLIDGRIKDMATELQGDSILLPDEFDTALQALITGDKPTDAILNKLRSDLFTKNNILPENIQTFDGYRLLREREAKLQATIDTAPTDAAVQEAQARLPEVQQRITELEERLDDGGDLHDQYTAYLKIVQATMPQNQGIYSSFGEKLNDAVKANRQIKEADKTIKAKEAAATAKNKVWRADRLQKESSLNDDMEAVFDEASLKYLEQISLEAQAALDQEVEQKAKDAEKLGDVRLAEAERRLRQKQKDHGVSYDETTRKRKINHAQLAEDVRSLAYHGEEGFQRLALRDLTEGDNPFKFRALVRDKNGNILKEADGTTDRTRPFKVGEDDLSLLAPEDAKLLEKLVENMREPYLNKLFGDFAIARSSGISGARHLRLKNHEYALLEENFGSFLESKANTPEKVKQAIQAAKEKGPKGKGFLLMLLSILAGMVVGAKQKL